MDVNSYSASIAGRPLSLTKKEFELLWLFINHPDVVFSRDILLDKIWGIDYIGDIRTVDAHIKRLRAKLGVLSPYDKLIKTIWGVGYKYAPHE